MKDDIGLDMFKLTAKGYCCTQIMVKMALDAEGKENEDLLRAANGLCFGAGSDQRTCGVLTGGIAVLGLYAGKGTDREYPKQDFSKMLDDYTNWFAAEFGSTECKGIIGVCSVTDYQTNQSYRLKCGEVLLKSYQKVLEILREYDYDFGNRDTAI